MASYLSCREFSYFMHLDIDGLYVDNTIRARARFHVNVSKCLEGDATIRPSSAELVSAMKQIESTLKSTEPSKII